MKDQKTIGILGGGQLGRMLTLAALPLGFRVIVLTPTPNSPAKQAGAEEIIGDLYDPAALQELAKRSDSVTIEIEHLNAQALEALESTGKSVNPAARTVKMIQDKLLQKQFLEAAGIAVAPFLPVTDQVSAVAALKEFGGSMVLKTRRGGYDGRGNAVVTSEDEINQAFEDFDGEQLYAEKVIPFTKELAVMVARSVSGETAVYPVVETIHIRNICIEVLAPAPIPTEQRELAEHLADRVANLLEGAGVFAIEMFLTEDGEVIVNEIAPRVHNSGHYTIEGAETSQFEQHIRAISGLPLGATDLIVPAAVMVNILGDRNGPTIVTGLDEALKTPGTAVHIYGKSPTKIDRKMGHITSTGKTIEEARNAARKARKHLSI